MADDTREVFLGGLPIAIEPTEIEHSLSQLWKPASDGPGVTRVALGTLVVVADESAANTIEALCREVSLAYPSRVAVVLLGDKPRLEASVFATCSLPEAGKAQVCGETIVLRVGPDHREQLSGLVLPLLLPDVMASLFWLHPTAPGDAVLRDLAPNVDRIVTQLETAADPAATWRAFGARWPQKTVDLAWRRGSAWREAIAQFFDGDRRSATPCGIDVVCVESASRWDAALLAGWVAGQLGWQPTERGDDGASVWRRRDGSTTSVTLKSAPRDAAARATLSASCVDGRWEATRRGEKLALSAHCRDWCALPFTVSLPSGGPAWEWLQTLTSRPSDASRERATARAAWLSGAVDEMAG